MNSSFFFIFFNHNNLFFFFFCKKLVMRPGTKGFQRLNDPLLKLRQSAAYVACIYFVKPPTRMHIIRLIIEVPLKNNINICHPCYLWPIPNPYPLPTLNLSLPGNRIGNQGAIDLAWLRCSRKLRSLLRTLKLTKTPSTCPTTGLVK